MLRLYTLGELERELSPDEFQHILTPDAALEKAAFTYDLDYRNYVSPPVNEAPNLLPLPRDKPYIRSGYDPVYDTLEVNLMEGWIVGLDTDEYWDDTVNPFHINAAGELVFDGGDPSCWVVSDFQLTINNHNGKNPLPQRNSARQVSQCNMPRPQKPSTAKQRADCATTRRCCACEVRYMNLMPSFHA